MSTEAKKFKPLTSAELERVIYEPKSTCEDMIRFAEYLQVKHNQGYVVYWNKWHDRFDVCNWTDWISDYADRTSTGESHWYTSLCPINEEVTNELGHG